MDNVASFLKSVFKKITDQRIREKQIEYSNSKIEKVVEEAIREGLEKRRRLGLPIAIWEDGKVVNLTSEEFKVLRDAEDKKNKE